MSHSLITKTACGNALKELMEHMPLNKIKVHHITDTCKLNRQTFYYHFQDIFDLLGWIYKNEVIESLERFLYTVTNELLMGVTTEISAQTNVSEEDKKFIANYYTLAFIGLVIQWMRSGMKENPEKLVRDLSKLIEGNLERGLHKFEQ